MSLEGDNPLAFIGYGMQPASEEPEKRYQKLRKHIERFPGGPLRQAIEQGLSYLARTHDYDDLESFQRDMESALS